MAAGIHIAVDLVCCALIFACGVFVGHRLSLWLAERIPADLLPEQSKCAPPPRKPEPRPRGRVSEFAPKPKFVKAKPMRLAHWPQPSSRVEWPPAREAVPPPPVVQAPQHGPEAAAGRDLLPKIEWKHEAMVKSLTTADEQGEA